MQMATAQDVRHEQRSRLASHIAATTRIDTLREIRSARLYALQGSPASCAAQLTMLRITATLSLARALATGGPRKLRAIALDLDGTLCNSAGVVTDATAAALAAFDGTIIIATGRGKSHAAGIASDLRKRGAIVDALVCSDGAVAYAGHAFDELVFERVAAGSLSPALQANRNRCAGRVLRSRDQRRRRHRHLESALSRHHSTPQSSICR